MVRHPLLRSGACLLLTLIACVFALGLYQGISRAGDVPRARIIDTGVNPQTPAAGADPAPVQTAPLPVSVGPGARGGPDTDMSTSGAGDSGSRTTQTNQSGAAAAAAAAGAAAVGLGWTLTTRRRKVTVPVYESQPIIKRVQVGVRTTTRKVLAGIRKVPKQITEWVTRRVQKVVGYRWQLQRQLTGYRRWTEKVFDRWDYYRARVLSHYRTYTQWVKRTRTYTTWQKVTRWVAQKVTSWRWVTRWRTSYRRVRAWWGGWTWRAVRKPYTTRVPTTRTVYRPVTTYRPVTRTKTYYQPVTRREPVYRWEWQRRAIYRTVERKEPIYRTVPVRVPIEKWVDEKVPVTKTVYVDEPVYREETVQEPVYEDRVVGHRQVQVGAREEWREEQVRVPVSEPARGYGTPDYTNIEQAVAARKNDERLQSDWRFVQSEIERTEQVIENRRRAGFDTGAQETYLNRLQQISLGNGDPNYAVAGQAEAARKNDERLAADPAYVASEVERAKWVIQNRKDKGLDTLAQDAYLNRLLNQTEGQADPDSSTARIATTTSAASETSATSAAQGAGRRAQDTGPHTDNAASAVRSHYDAGLGKEPLASAQAPQANQVAPSSQTSPVPVGPTHTTIPNFEHRQFIQKLFGIRNEEGTYGPRTQCAVAAVQREHGIPIDRNFKIGTKTWELLLRIHGKELSVPELKPTFKTIDGQLTASPLPPEWMHVKPGDGFEFRTHPIGGYRYRHQGVDFSPGGTQARGVPVFAVRKGTVIKAHNTCLHEGEAYYDCGNTYGNHVDIRHDDGTVTRYAHLSAGTVAVRVGETVNAGDLLGLIGSTGKSTGPHLHFEHRDRESRVQDPLKTIIPGLFRSR